MHKPDPVEAILARLMPPALSTTAQHDIETMLDELAAESGPTTAAQGPVRRHSWWRWWMNGGIAAALAILLAHAPSPRSTAISHAQATPLEELPAGVVLVGESDRVQSMTDEGWQEDPDGSAMRAVRLNVIEENSLLDEETGIVVQVYQPREEILLTPVSTF